MPTSKIAPFVSLLLAAAVATALAPAPVVSRTAVTTQGWSIYKNERFGFQLSYPGGLFAPAATANPDSGAMWTSADGQARLIATAAPNETGETLESYRDFVMRESYSDARLDYAPTKETWFVLSGQQGDNMFYERITFVCDGRFIYGWQLRYPAGLRRKYEQIVEAIHQSYKVGRGAGGSCEQPSQ